MAYNTNQDRLLNAIKQSGKSALGGCGSVYVDDAAAHVGTFIAIMALEAAVISTATISNIDDFDADITLDAGMTIFGSFSSVTLTSGKVVVYKTC
jgi:hypothetical protein